MDKSPARLLQVIITLTLFNLAPDGRATTYDDDRFVIVPPFDEPPVREPLEEPPDHGEFTDDGGDREGSDGSGGEFADEEAHDEEDRAKECAAIVAKVDASCDLENPPLIDPNGCGSGTSENLVPDYLFVGGVAAYRLGPIFRQACNFHDVCYGTYGTDKEACDMVLHDDMIDFAQFQMTPTQWFFYRSHVGSQAYAYSAGLQAPFLRELAGAAFENAQLEGACRYYADKAEKAGCL